MKPNLAKVVKGRVEDRHIGDGKCRNPNKCMIKLSVAEVIGIPHGYISVDSTGISITRRADYREKAFITKPMVIAMLRYDKGLPVKPFSWKLTFYKTTNVYRSSDKRRAQVNAARAKRKAEGRPDKKYSLRKRIEGLAVSKEIMEQVSK